MKTMSRSLREWEDLFFRGRGKVVQGMDDMAGVASLNVKSSKFPLAKMSRVSANVTMS